MAAEHGARRPQGCIGRTQRAGSTERFHAEPPRAPGAAEPDGSQAYFTISSSSTSNVSVAPGLIRGGLPRSP